MLGGEYEIMYRFLRSMMTFCARSAKSDSPISMGPGDIVAGPRDCYRGCTMKNATFATHMKWICLFCWTTVAAAAQPVGVYTEFARLDALGKVLAPETPREILSPALVRNGFTSFQVAIMAEKGEPWRLFIGQNPDNAVTVTMYRETGQRLEPVELPVEGDGPAVLWMDVWTARGAPVARIKIEPQLDYRQDWVIYPIEGRVMEATAGDGPAPPGSGDAVDVMRGLVCAAKPGEEVPSPASAPLTIARLRYRNARQDLTLAAHAPREELQKLFGPCEAPPPDDVEWYLRIRDYLFRLR